MLFIRRVVVTWPVGGDCGWSDIFLSINKDGCRGIRPNLKGLVKEVIDFARCQLREELGLWTGEGDQRFFYG